MTAKKKVAKKRVVKKVAKKPVTKIAKTRVATKKPMRKAVKKVAKRKAAHKPRKPNAAFLKPIAPSAALAVIVGSAPLPRTEITKRLWEYIKKNKLQDTVNRRMINADPALCVVFSGKRRVSMFEMTKLVASHLLGKGGRTGAAKATRKKVHKKAGPKAHGPGPGSI